MKLTREGLKKLLKEEKVLQKQLQEAQRSKRDIAGFSGSRGDGRIELFGIEEEIGCIGARLIEVRRNISQAVLIEDEKDMGTLRIGQKARVILSGEEMVIRVTDPVSTDVNNGSISYNSPLARAVLGSKPGDRREYEVLGNNFIVEIVEINV